MLINKTDKPVKLRYNGVEKTIESGAAIDVRDFNMPNAEVKPVEKHIMVKYPGLFDSEPTKIGDKAVVEEYLGRIKELEKEKEVLTKALEAKNEEAKNYHEKFSVLNGEVNTSRRETESVRKEIKLLQASVKDLEEENENLRTQVARSSIDEKKGPGRPHKE